VLLFENEGAFSDENWREGGDPGIKCLAKNKKNCIFYTGGAAKTNRRETRKESTSPK